MKTDPRGLLALGVFGRGSRVGDRIEMLLKSGREVSPRVSPAGVTMSAAGLLAWVLFGAVAPKLIAFAEATPAFEVASVRPGSDSGGSSVRVSAQGIDYTRVPLSRIVAEAYQMPYGRISGGDSRSLGLLSDTYDIIAKADRPVPREQLMSMLQTLLAERFKLTVRHEAKAEPVYKLSVAKSGAKLKETVFEGTSSTALGPDGEMVFRNIEMWRFAAYLSGRMDRPVVDATGLAGAFDFTLKLQSLQEPLATADDDAAKRAMSDWSQSSIFTDIEKQVGLGLKADKAPVDHLIVDHVEKPDAN